MSVEKFSVSFDPDLGRQIREFADLNDESVSAFLAEAARERLRTLILRQLISQEADRLGTTAQSLAEEGRAILDAVPTTASRSKRRKSAAA